jgi:hypothetical protein
MLPEGNPPIDSSKADIPLERFCNFSNLSLSLLSPVFPGEALLVDGLGFPLNPLFHYLRTVGYWNRPRNDLFEAQVNGFGAFSVEYGGAFAHDSHFSHQ